MPHARQLKMGDFARCFLFNKFACGNLRLLYSNLMVGFFFLAALVSTSSPAVTQGSSAATIYGCRVTLTPDAVGGAAFDFPRHGTSGKAEQPSAHLRAHHNPTSHRAGIASQPVRNRPAESGPESTANQPWVTTRIGG